MNTELLPRQPADSDDAGGQNDHVEERTAAAPGQPVDNTGPAFDDSDDEEPERYPPPDTPCM
jgi:hypothetical protein